MKDAEAVWNVEVAAVSPTVASELVQLLAQIGHEAQAIDPKRWLTWHLDHASVEALSIGLKAATQGREVDDSVVRAGLQSLLEDCESWLG